MAREELHPGWLPQELVGGAEGPALLEYRDGLAPFHASGEEDTTGEDGFDFAVASF
jgi:hypothetical protein